MPYFFSLLILMAVSLVLPANGHASSYERSNRAEPATRAQTPWMLICPLQSGPSTILVWTLKERENGQETRA
jgi:hypothetical protein